MVSEKQRFGTVELIAILLILCVLGLVGYQLYQRAADWLFPNWTITEAIFARMEKGMTEAEVAQLAGGRGKKLSKDEAVPYGLLARWPGTSVMKYRFPGEFNQEVAYVQFKNGRLLAKVL